MFIMQHSNTFLLSSYSFQAFFVTMIMHTTGSMILMIWRKITMTRSYSLLVTFSIRGHFFLYTLWQVDKAPMEYNQRNGIYTCQNDGTLGSSSEYSWYHTSAPERSNRELAQVLSLGHRQKTSTDSTDPITISNLIILLKQQ